MDVESYLWKLEKLKKAGVTGNSETETILLKLRNEPFSLVPEIRFILFLGALLFSGGIGVLIYKHIDTIGHTILIIALSIACISCFLYSIQKSPHYSHSEVKSTLAQDYILLLGCLLFVSVEGYLQYQYNLFGSKYGIAAFVPALLYLFAAFRFDHKGVLSLGITALAVWAGVTSRPLNSLEFELPGEKALILRGVILALGLFLSMQLLINKNIKPHFSFTVNSFAVNLLLPSLLGALIYFQWNFISLLLLLSASFYVFRLSKKFHSYFLLIIAVIYAYIGLTYFIFQFEYLLGLFMLYYFILTCAGVIYFLVNLKKFLRND